MRGFSRERIFYKTNVLLMTKKRIVRIAATMFGQYGLRGVTIDAICQAMGIAKKTYYSFYANKDALVAYFVEVTFADLFQGLSHEHDQPDPIVRLTRFDAKLLAFFAVFNPVAVIDMKRHYEQAFSFFTTRRGMLLRHIAEIIEYGMLNSTFRTDIDPMIIAELRLTEIETLFSGHHQKNFSELHRTQDQFFAHYLAGLSASSAYCREGRP